MPSLLTLASFFGFSVLLAASPGPDNLFVLTLAAQRGVRAGLWVVLGLCSGLLVHTALVAAGVAAVLAASPLAFSVLRWAGAAYLLWMAWGAWHAPAQTTEGLPAAPDGAGARQMVLRGFVMNVTNPKVALFFLAFLPQFLRADQGLAAQTVLLGALFMLAAGLVFSAIATMAGAVGPRLTRSATAQRALNRAAALVFIGLALHLLINQAR